MGPVTLGLDPPPCAKASPPGSPAATASPAVAAAADRSAHREFFIHAPCSNDGDPPTSLSVNRITDI